MTTPIKTQAQAFKIGLMEFPIEYIAMPVIFDFTTDPAQTLTKDFVQEMQQGKIGIIQAVYIDNSADAIALSLTILNSGIPQTIIVKGNTQGVYPIMQQEGPFAVQVISIASVAKKTLIFLSMPAPFVSWATA